MKKFFQHICPISIAVEMQLEVKLEIEYKIIYSTKGAGSFSRNIANVSECKKIERWSDHHNDYIRLYSSRQKKRERNRQWSARDEKGKMKMLKLDGQKMQKDRKQKHLLEDNAWKDKISLKF